MFETNEEITERLKQSIHDYYMGYIKQKLNSLLANGKENEISSQIMEFLDAQIDTANNLIVKDDIIRILNSVLLGSEFADSNVQENRILYCFPATSDITIEDSKAAYVVEKFQTPFNGIEEKSYYLFLAPDHYDKNIINIENEIKKLEKSFTRHDIQEFEQKFNEDLNVKQYELESAKVYESASKQIELKKQKFNSANQKVLSEYGKKYEEILAKDISEEEKYNLAKELLQETKSSDEKNRQAVLRLNNEYDRLVQDFNGKVQDSNTIYKQMQNLHLFDKSRFFEDMRSSIEPNLRDLYKKRYLLNSYRKLHNEPIYKGQSNAFFKFFQNLSINTKSSTLALGPHIGRDYNNSPVSSSPNAEDIDKNLVKALASFYSTPVVGDKVDFENTLIDYFKINYKELIGDKSSNFLYKFSKTSSENSDEGNLFKIARHYEIDVNSFENNYGADLVIKDGLIYEENENGLNVIYATDKAINTTIEDLYSNALYYKHLARENALSSINAISLQNSFVEYAKENNIELENAKHSQDLKYKKRFIQKKEEKENILDFKKTC